MGIAESLLLEDPAAGAPASSQAVIADLRQHGIAYTADNYAVWHCYMSGTNMALRRAVDVVLSNGRAIDERMLRALYARHFCHAREATALRDVARRSLRTLAELTKGPESRIARRCLDELGRDMQDIINQSDRLTRQLRQSDERIAQLEDFLDSARLDASTDGLTGIANRRAFDAVLREKAGHAMNEGAPLGFVLIDIDRFKLFNDRWGHAVGDQVLRTVAGTLVSHVRGTDTVARYGGEEFAVILPGTGEQGALAAAEHLRLAVEQQTAASDIAGAGTLHVTISAGVSCYEHGEPLGAWIHRADAALYGAKAAGRNRVAFGNLAAPLALAAPHVPLLSRAG